MKKLLVLDDDESRHKIFRQLLESPMMTNVFTAKDCISQLSKKEFDVVSLDHDLGGKVYVDPEEENTGYQVVKWMITNKPKVSTIVVHSWNEKAAQRMVDELIAAGFNVLRHGFKPSLVRRIHDYLWNVTDNV